MCSHSRVRVPLRAFLLPFSFLSFNQTNPILTHPLCENKQPKNIRRLTVVNGDSDNDNSHNQTVQGKSLSENQHQNHADEDLLLLTTSADTCRSTRRNTPTGISSNTDRKTSSETRETAAQTGSQMTVAVEAGVVRATSRGGLDYR